MDGKWYLVELANPSEAPGTSYDESLGKALGISRSMLVMFPELQPVFDLLAEGKDTQAEQLFYGTDFYKNNIGTVQSRLASKAQQPGAYAKLLEDYKLKTKKRLSQLGVRGMSGSDFDELAQLAYDTGMSDTQVDQWITQHNKLGAVGGTTGGDIADLQSYARSFGVSGYIGKDYWANKSTSLFSGDITSEDIKTDIRNMAASAFPGYADQIRNGVTVDAIASAYKGAIANILEVDPDSVTYDDPHLKQALQAIGPDGKPIVKPLWQFEKELRATKQWEYTNNARDSLDTLSLKVLRDMGLA